MQNKTFIFISLFVLYSCDLTQEISRDLPSGAIAELSFTLDGDNYNDDKFHFTILKESVQARLYRCDRDSSSGHTTIGFSGSMGSFPPSSAIILMQIAGAESGEFPWSSIFSFSLSMGGLGQSIFYRASDADLGTFKISQYGKVDELIKMTFSGYLVESPSDSTSQRISISGKFTGKRQN